MAGMPLFAQRLLRHPHTLAAAAAAAAAVGVATATGALQDRLPVPAWCSAIPSAEAACEAAAKPAGELVLKQAIAIFRHGARTPIPVTDERWDQELCGQAKELMRALRVTHLEGGPRPLSVVDQRYLSALHPGGCSSGSLTQLGRRQALELGQRLGAEYLGRLGLTQDDYSTEEVFVRSTNVTRTLETARGVLTGLFGQAGTHCHVVTARDSEEHWYPNRSRCGRLKELLKEHRSSGFDHDDSKAFMNDLSVRLGRKVGRQDMFVTLDVLVANDAHGKELPKPFRPSDIERAVRVITRAVMSVYDHQEMPALAIGPALAEVRQRLEAAAAEQAGAPKLCLYSGHDTTLLPVLASLDIFDGEWPTFCSCVQIELYQDDAAGHYVRTAYKGKAAPLPGCDGAEYCPLDTFLGVLSASIAQDYAAACRPVGAARTKNGDAAGSPA